MIQGRAKSPSCREGKPRASGDDPRHRRWRNRRGTVNLARAGVTPETAYGITGVEVGLPWTSLEITGLLNTRALWGPASICSSRKFRASGDDRDGSGVANTF